MKVTVEAIKILKVVEKYSEVKFNFDELPLGGVSAP